jgi:hypothetical protein
LSDLRESSICSAARANAANFALAKDAASSRERKVYRSAKPRATASKKIHPNRRLRECVQRPKFLQTLQDCDLEQSLRDWGIVQLPTVEERLHASYRLSNHNSTASIHGPGNMKKIPRGFVDHGPTSHTHLQQVRSQNRAVLRLGQIFHNHGLSDAATTEVSSRRSTEALLMAPALPQRRRLYRLHQCLGHLTEFRSCFTHSSRDSHEWALQPPGHVGSANRTSDSLNVRKRGPMDPHIEKLLYSRQDAAVALSVSLRSIDYLISDGKLTTRRIGRKTLIPVTDIRRFARGDHPEGIRMDARRRLSIPTHKKQRLTG